MFMGSRKRHPHLLSPAVMIVSICLAVMFGFVAGCQCPTWQCGQDGHQFNGTYKGEHLDYVAFPMGGIGAGMLCIEGNGQLTHLSLRHRPEVFNEPYTYSAVCVKQPDGNIARVLEGPLPMWKLFGTPGAGNGLGNKTYGLPRFDDAEFLARFPFATVSLTDEDLPLAVEVTGWSPFTPPDADASSLPVAGLEYRFKNTSGHKIEAVYSFNTKNFMASGSPGQSVLRTDNGLVLHQKAPEDKPWEAGDFVARVADADAKVNPAWFRGAWFDPNTMAWKDVQQGRAYDAEPLGEEASSPGGTIFVPFTLDPGQEKTVTLQMAWYVPTSNLRIGEEVDKNAEQAKQQCCPGGDCGPQHYKPWYATRFKDVYEVADYWKSNYRDLREQSARFRDCFYDTNLPPVVVEAVAANLTILKSPTVLRQYDGKLWCYEGCCDDRGCCHGSCTHVWNYAQAIPHLFPVLERSLRETEFFCSQDDRGHQAFRTALPIRPTTHNFHAASDGQLGGIMKMHREWRISGDTEWLRKFWPQVKSSLDYCIATWDPDGQGVLLEPHHNTYDIEFWGAEPMCSSFYLGALKAAVHMGSALGEDVSRYRELLDKGQAYVNEKLYNGEYYYQQIQWEGLHAPDPTKVQSFHGGYSPEAIELLKKEGPKYQYGNGCLSDGVLGVWMSQVCGVGPILDDARVQSHLASVHKYNLKEDLSDHVNPQRPTFAAGTDGGLLLCSWPHGDALSLPFVYSNEVWTGIEYQVASHLMIEGMIDEGLDIVREVRKRYDGTIRNPFNEYECGHWYARAMSSYGLLQGLAGVRYDAVDQTLYIEPSMAGDFESFLSTATGYGTVGVRGGKPFIDVKSGEITVKEIEYTPAQ